MIVDDRNAWIFFHRFAQVLLGEEQYKVKDDLETVFELSACVSFVRQHSMKNVSAG